jgi:hypothetical protein
MMVGFMRSVMVLPTSTSVASRNRKGRERFERRNSTKATDNLAPF